MPAFARSALVSLMAIFCGFAIDEAASTEPYKASGHNIYFTPESTLEALKSGAYGSPKSITTGSTTFQFIVQAATCENLEPLDPTNTNRNALAAIPSSPTSAILEAAKALAQSAQADIPALAKLSYATFASKLLGTAWELDAQCCSGNLPCCGLSSHCCNDKEESCCPENKYEVIQTLISNVAPTPVDLSALAYESTAATPAPDKILASIVSTEYEVEVPAAYHAEDLFSQRHFNETDSTYCTQSKVGHTVRPDSTLFYVFDRSYSWAIGICPK